MSNIDATGESANRPQVQHNPTASMYLNGHRFALFGTQGKTCQVVSTWAYPFEDDAIKLAHLVVESQVLSAFQSGVLWQDGQFSSAMVESLRTTLDALPSIVETLDHEEPLHAQTGRISERSGQ